MNLPQSPHTSGADPGEVSFRFDEIFYSRTDARGVIQAGNSVFQRISGHPWSGLIGAPHRIVRNSDTPRAVFWLLWSAIKRGQSLGAYVKNIARDGRPYWTFAVVMPISDGYLSVRFKPSSPLFATIRQEYEDLSAREKAENLQPEQSANLFLARLAALGFADYAAFMAHALSAELALRDAALGRGAEPQSRMLAGVGQSLATAIAEQRALAGTFESLQSIPTNMRIVASRLEPAGGPISAIADNYKITSAEILTRLRAFAGQSGNLGAQTAATVGQQLFYLGCARVQSETVRQFRAEPPNDAPTDRAREVVYLERLEAECLARARAGLNESASVAAQLSRASQDIRRMMLGLDSIRVMGRVESGRLRVNGAGLSATIDQLDHYHAEIKAHLDAITDSAEHIRRTIEAAEARAA